ncbi:hypothetical protein H257_12079 [Aphanomyces astaci]|uniref:DUF7769 domain-containing protein n=1 Tax=Aphanomyces astaci TaxID=112090 RepID=W4G031_APHAT|nr:hypothetical protein H257_12079 [Aphanomyces astaci]ETV73042.1 hypothetical protein H257_12079 [Aphanomyces astaci]|eukprot:XP_009837491.1 hypothetical protein H257_12079 [Aphanomyces astaci]
MPPRSPRRTGDASVAVRDLADVRKHLSFAHRRTAYETLLSVAVDDVLPRGALTELAQMFSCHPRTISRLWTQVRLSLRGGHCAADVASKTKGNSGRHALRTSDEIEAAIRNVLQMQRQTLRSLSAAYGIPMTTIFSHMKKNPRFKARSNYVKPHLTPANIEERLKFAMSFVRPLPSGRHLFNDMHDYVHVDEKWFYLMKVKRRYYMYNDEEVAARAVKSKRFITKVMFLAAVARPRYDPHGKKEWDGNGGVWPFVQVAPAQRGSKNRPKGAMLSDPLLTTSVGCMTVVAIPVSSKVS